MRLLFAAAAPGPEVPNSLNRASQGYQVVLMPFLALLCIKVQPSFFIWLSIRQATKHAEGFLSGSPCGCQGRPSHTELLLIEAFSFASMQ